MNNPTLRVWSRFGSTGLRTLALLVMALGLISSPLEGRLNCYETLHGHSSCQTDPQQWDDDDEWCNIQCFDAFGISCPAGNFLSSNVPDEVTEHLTCSDGKTRSSWNCECTDAGR
jgi:hypothetical protein